MAELITIIIVGILGFAAFLVYVQWRVFVKASKPGWAVLVPIYSTIVLLEIVNKPGWWFFLFLIPIVNIYFLVVAINRLSKSFGKGAGFTVGLILLPMIFYAILAFDDSEYQMIID